MGRKLLPLIFILCTSSLFAQKNLVNGFIILETNDTISGELKDKKYL